MSWITKYEQLIPSARCICIKQGGTIKYVSAVYGKRNGEIVILRGSTWYVRPEGTVYGRGDGTSYEDAWSGFADIDWLSILPGHILYVCGTHNDTLYIVNVHGETGLKITIDFNYQADPGKINGLTTIDPTSWELYSGDVYRTPIVTDIDYEQDAIPANPSVGEKWFNLDNECANDYLNTVFNSDADGTAMQADVTQYEYVNRAEILEYTSDLEWRRATDYFLKPGYVMVNGTRENPSRYPAVTAGYAVPVPRGSYACLRNLTRTANGNITQAQLNKPDNYWQGGYVILHNVNWMIEHRKINSSSGSTIYHSPFSTNQFESYSAMHIENVVGEISATGKWAFKDDYLYCKLADPTNDTVQYSSLCCGIVVKNSSHIDITGIDCRYVNDIGVYLFKCSNVAVKNGTFNEIHAFDMGVPMSGAIYFDICENPIAEDNTISFIRSCTGISFNGCYGGSGSICRNIISYCAHDINFAYTFGMGIYGLWNNNTTGLLVDSNVIQYTGGNGIQMNAPYAIVSNNTVKNVVLTTADNHAIGCHSEPSWDRAHHITFADNLIENVGFYSDSAVVSRPAMGVRLDGGAVVGTLGGVHDTVIERNTFFHIEGAAILIKGSNNTVRYNDMYNNDDYIVLVNESGTVLTDNNEYTEAEYVG